MSCCPLLCMYHSTSDLLNDHDSRPHAVSLLYITIKLEGFDSRHVGVLDKSCVMCVGLGNGSRNLARRRLHSRPDISRLLVPDHPITSSSTTQHAWPLFRRIYSKATCESSPTTRTSLDSLVDDFVRHAPGVALVSPGISDCLADTLHG